MTTQTDSIVKLIIDGENLLSNDINDAVNDLEKLSKESRDTSKELKELRAAQQASQDFIRLSQSIDKTDKELVEARANLIEIKKEFKAAGDSADANLTRRLSRAEQEVRKLGSSFTAQNSELRRTEKALRNYGVNTKDVANELNGLSERVTETSNKQKRLTDQYKELRSEARQNVDQVRAEKAEQLKLIETLELTENQRKELTNIVERQLLSTRRIADIIDEELISRRKISGVLKNESDARQRNVAAFKALSDEAKNQAAELARTERAIAEYSKQFDQLVRQQERGEISTREFINAEKELIASLGLTKNSVQGVRAEIRAIALDEEKAAQSANKVARSQQELAVVTRAYRNRLRDLHNSYLEGTLNAEQYESAVKKLRQQLDLSKTEVNDLTRAIEKDNKALRDSQVAFDKEQAKIKQTAAETQRLEKTLGIYRRELEKLNKAKASGKIDTDKYEASERKLRQGLKLSEKQVKETRQEFDNLASSRANAARSTDALTQVTRRLAQAYTVLLAAQKTAETVGASVQSYGELEAAITKVTKTTGTAREEVIAMAGQLQEFATEITPTATNELLRMAEVAGQLGAKSTEDILNLTIAADALGNSTNLAGDEAVTLLTRILSMTNEGLPAIGNLASSVVELGNNFAASEDEIVNMTKELVTGTRAINLSSAAAAGFGATLRELGQPAERTRSAIARISQVIQEASLNGGEDLEKLAQITGLTADEIEKNLGDRPEEVLIRFAEGLNTLNESGQSVSTSLRAFGITSQETVSVLGTLSKNTERLRQGVELSNQAYIDGTKHLKEAAQAYADQESQIGRLVNQFEELKASIGEAFSDETNQLVNDLSSVMDSAGGSLLEFTNSLADVFDFIRELGESIINLGQALGVTDSASRQLSASFDAILLAGQSLVTGFNVLALGVNELKIAVLDFFGASTEELDKYRQKSQEITNDINESIRSQTNTIKRFTGESSGIYEDFINTIENNAAAIENLDQKTKAQIQSLVEQGRYNRENTELYAELTAAVVRQIRVDELYEAQKQQAAALAQQRAADERKRNLERIDSEQKINQLIERTSENSQELAEKERLIQLARDEGKLSAEQYAQAINSLATNRESLKAASQEELDLTIKAIQANQDNSKAVNDLEVQIAKYERKLRELDIQQRNAVASGEKQNELALEQTRITQQLEQATEKLRVTKELESKTQQEINIVADSHILQLENLKQQYQSGAITAGEYNKAKQDLQITTQLLLQFGSEEVQQRINEALATNTVTESIEQLVIAKRRLNNANSETATSLARQNDELAKNAQHAGVSEALSNLWRQAQERLNQEIDHSGKSIEDLNQELFELNEETRAYQATISKPTFDTLGLFRGITRMTELAQANERAILEQSITLQQWINNVDSGTLSLSQLNNMAASADTYFSRLSDNQLEPLRNAISSAQREFASLSSNINRTFDSLQDRLDNLRGDQLSILNRAYERELAELQQLLTQAERSRDTNLVSRVEDSIRNLNAAHQIEVQNLKTELEEQKRRANQTDSTNQNNIRDGQPTTTRHTIELKLPNNTTEEITVGSQADADTLLRALEALGQVNIGGNP